MYRLLCSLTSNNHYMCVKTLDISTIKYYKYVFFEPIHIFKEFKILIKHNQFLCM